MTQRIAQAAIKRDRNVVLGGLVSLVGVTALLTIQMAQQVAEPATLLHPRALGHAHGGYGFLSLFAMWSVMQIAMMSPTAVPMVLMHAKIARHRREHARPYTATALFLSGYLIVWTLFSLTFAAVQSLLQRLDLLSPAMASNTPWLAAALLIAAGLFQFSSLKHACLTQCRSPVPYFMGQWRNGHAGALVMGLKHGVHCVGCCWILMALLFVAGVMNLLWMALITAFVLIEKLAPRGDEIGRIAGVGLILWGLIVLL